MCIKCDDTSIQSLSYGNQANRCTLYLALGVCELFLDANVVRSLDFFSLSLYPPSPPGVAVKRPPANDFFSPSLPALPGRPHSTQVKGLTGRSCLPNPNPRISDSKKLTQSSR